MNKRWMWVLSLLAAGFLVTGTSALFAKSDEGESEVAGSIVIPSEDAILANMATVSLVDAVKAAVAHKAGKAIAAELEDEDGFLVYAVDIVMDNKSVMEVTVDAGNKKILKAELQDEDEYEGKGDKAEKCDMGEKCEYKKGGREED